jgi:predicted DNA-binding transcriptional regulator AlpA
MRLLVETEVRNLLGVNRATLRRWRQRNTGPPFLKLGPKLIRYREDDLAAFLDSRKGLANRDCHGKREESADRGVRREERVGAD